MLQWTHPNAAKSHGAIVPVQHEGTGADLVAVFGQRAVLGLAPDDLMVMHQDTIVEHGEPGGLHILALNRDILHLIL